MPTPIEAEIRQILIDTNDTMIVAKQLIKRWHAGVLADEDIQCICRFLIQSNLVALLLNSCRKELKKDSRLPWGALAESIRILKVKLEPYEVDALFEGIDSQSKTFHTNLLEEDLSRSHGLDLIDSRPAAARKEFRSRKKRQHEEKRADLLRRLEYARINRLINQERRILEEIQTFDPDDPEIRKQKELFEFREAQEIVADALALSPPKSAIEQKLLQLSPDIKKASRPIVKEITARAATANEQELYDMAMMLIFMELYEDAIAILEKRRVSEKIDWLLLETMIIGRQYASALGEVENLEVKYMGMTEAVFTLTYARARALWGLGDTVTAIELLKSLVRVRPTYRSATTLLQQWIEEAP